MNEWISIDDKLPPTNSMVLVYAPLNHHTSGGITYGFYDSYAGQFYHHGSGMRRQYDIIEDQVHKRSEQLWTAVTHWMELPSKPSEVDDNE
jgi:hypothetical protein